MAKVALLYESLGRSRGGIETWIYHAAEELLKQQNEVVVFHSQENMPSDALPEGVENRSLLVNQGIVATRFVWSVAQLRRQLKSHLSEYDHVWARSFTLGLAAYRILGKDKVMYINAAPHSFYGRSSFADYLKMHPGFGGLLRAVSMEVYYRSSWIMERITIRNCINIFLSKAREEQTRLHFRLQKNSFTSYVIPAGVNPDRFFPADKGWRASDPLRIISVGRLTPDKNFQCIIDALDILVRENYSVFLTIIGEGRYEMQLKERVASLNLHDRIEFVGRQEEVENWYRNSHLFVLPSLYEGFGSVYIEAMASGLPCIALRDKNEKYMVAAGEIIDHGRCGWLMQENDPKELASLIKRVFHDPEQYHNMCVYARTKALEEYSWGKIISKLMALGKG